MKRTLLKIGNVASYVVIGAGSVYTLSAVLYGILPADVTQPVIDTLNMNSSVIVPTGISAGAMAGIITTAKIMLSSLREKLKQSNLSLQLWETDVNEKINTRFQLQDELNDIVVQKVNQTLEQNKILIAQQNALIKFNEITAIRNIASPLVPQGVKDEYKVALGNLTTLDTNYKPITKVVEEIIYKEVEKETTDKVRW